MAYLQLQPNVGYGLVGERAVFLDLRRDRYFALEHESARVLRDLRQGCDTSFAQAPAREALLATGLFRESALRGRLEPAAVPHLRESLLDEPPRRPGWRSVLRIWTAVARARRRIASTPLVTIIDALRESRYAPPRHADPLLAEDAARAFLAARALVPIGRNCLLDTLALLDGLGEAAGQATLVFGVRLDPFGAHCWLQTERKLLTDAQDLVGNFTPVLAV